MGSKEPVWASIKREWEEALAHVNASRLFPDGVEVASIGSHEEEDHYGNPVMRFTVVLKDWHSDRKELEEWIWEFLTPYNYKNIPFSFSYEVVE